MQAGRAGFLHEPLWPAWELGRGRRAARAVMVGVPLSFQCDYMGLPAYGLHTDGIAPKKKDLRPIAVSPFPAKSTGGGT